MSRGSKYKDEDLVSKSEGVKIEHKGANCYIYTRVSTMKQVEEGGSLEAQRDRVLEYVKYDNMSVVGEYTDEGISGKSAEQRPGFQQMIEDIQNKKDDIQFVLVYKLSRFGRNASDILYYLQIMQDNGVNLICVEDHIDSSDGTGKLMVSIMAAVAEIERENILAQSMNGRYKKARDGGWNGGLAPYGYKLKDGELVIDEGQAKIVELIFEKYAKTNLLADGIAKWLNEQGYKKSPPNILKENPDRQVEFLKEFSREQICRILDNEIYMGKIAYGKRKNYAVKNQRGVTVTKNQDQYGVYEGKHEAIISEELWNLAHEKRINSGGRSEKKEKEHEYILSTLIRCPECGSPMYGAVNRTKKRKDGTLYKPYYYYKCKNQFGQTGHSCTFKKQIGTRKIDESVRDIIMSLVQSKEFSDAIKSKIGEEIDTEEIENRIEYLKKELHQTEGALRKRSYEKDSLDVDDKHYDKKYEAIQRAEESLYDKQDEIEDAISELQSRIRGIKQNAVTKEKIYQVLVNFNEIYDKMSDREKQELMRLFIERIEIHKEKQPNGLYIKEIHFKFPIKSDGEENCDVIFPSLKDNCGDGSAFIQIKNG